MIALTSVALAGCGGGEDEEAEEVRETDSTTNGSDSGNGLSNGGSSGGDGTANGAPSISGKPLPQALPELQYVFAPTTSDPEKDSLTFSAENLPSWATFDSSTGRLSGTPTAADIGRYQGIAISVSDGEQTVSLTPFMIDVVAYGNASATLSWTAPTARTDGTPLMDLAGYRVFWGTSVGKYPKSVTINNPAVMTYVVEGLVPATYYFVATAVDSSGAESEHSNVASKTVN